MERTAMLARRTLIERIGAILNDHRNGLLGSDEDAADHILIAMREPTPAMVEAGDIVIGDGKSAIWVWRGMIEMGRDTA